MADRATFREPKIIGAKMNEVMEVSKKGYRVRMTVINSGTCNWTTRSHKIVAVTSSRKKVKTWGTVEVKLPRPLRSGGSAVLNFKVNAPKRSGKKYRFQWQVKGPAKYIPKASKPKKIIVETKKK